MSVSTSLCVWTGPAAGLGLSGFGLLTPVEGGTNLGAGICPLSADLLSLRI